MIKRAEKYLLRYPWYRKASKKLKTVSFFGFHGIPIYDVVSFLMKEIKRDTITDRAAAISFDFLLAFFPAIIFLLTLIPFIPIPNLDTTLLIAMQNVVPYEVYKLIHTSVSDIVIKERKGLLFFMFLFAVYYGVNGVSAIMHSFDKAYPTFKKRGFWGEKAAALRLLTLLFIFTLLALILIIAGESMINSILAGLRIEKNLAYSILFILKWLFIYSLLFMGYSLLYYFGPATHTKWRFFSTGSTLATILALIASLGFSFFINNFGQYNKFYGSIGTLIIFMLWIYINSVVLLIGFELNASIDINRNLHIETNPPEDL